ncbi:DNA internalization-related competence protein ComEC/Rec2 [bacterium]
MRNQPALKSVLILGTGIYWGSRLQIPFPIIYGLCLLTCVMGIYLLGTGKGTRSVQGFLLLTLLLLGMLRFYQAAIFLPPNHIIHSLRSDEPAEITGTVIRDPIIKKNRIDLLLEIQTVKYSDSLLNLKGKIIASIYTESRISLSYGDVIMLQCNLFEPRGKRNPGGFDHKAYLARKKIVVISKSQDLKSLQIIAKGKGNPILRECIYPVRRFINKTLNQSATGQSKAILQALLIGEKSGLVPEMRDAFAKAGIIHLLAVSGLHVGFVLIIFMTVFCLIRLPYSLRVVLTILGLIFYTLLTEGKAPVVRATLMTTLYLISTIIERRSDPLNIIGFAGLLILFINPQALFDIGFQLSFTAVLSILTFYKRLTVLPPISFLLKRYAGNPLIKYTLTILLVSLSAQIGTIPFTVIYFNRLPILSILVNIIAIPLTGLVLALGFTTVLMSLISAWIGQVYGTLNNEILHIFIQIIQWIGKIPFSYVYLPTPDLLHVITYFSSILLLFHLHNRVWRKRWVFLLLISLNGFIWNKALLNRYHHLTWTQFDVGQGDSAIIELPRGNYILIDGGNKTPHFDNGEHVVAPYLRRRGIHTLDAVILSHPHNDHIGGLLYILNCFNVKKVIAAQSVLSSPLSKQFIEIIRRKEIPLQTISSQVNLTHYPGVNILFSNPMLFNTDDITHKFHTNNQSLIVRISFGRTHLLFMGDAEHDAEKNLLQTNMPIHSNGIKVGHHGSHTSSGESFIKDVNPDAAVISVGENKHGHPSAKVLQRFERLKIPVYRTDLSGAVIFRSNGESLQNISWK